MVANVSTERVALKSFRLSDVPENIRRKHGERLVTFAYKRAVEDGVRGVALLTATLDAKQAMTSPSGNVYRVSQASWDAMIEEARKLDERQAARAG